MGTDKQSPSSNARQAVATVPFKEYSTQVVELLHGSKRLAGEWASQLGQTPHALLYNVVSLSQVHAGITSFACRDISTHIKWIVHRMDCRGCRSHRKDHSSCLIEILTSRTRLPSGGSPLSPARTYVKCPQGSFLRLCIFVVQENRMSIQQIPADRLWGYNEVQPL